MNRNVFPDNAPSLRFHVLSFPCVNIAIYKYNLLFSGDTTVGTMTVADLDGDGFVELVFAAYSAGLVYVYSYGPEV
jgi:hypothetical protein